MPTAQELLDGPQQPTQLAGVKPSAAELLDGPQQPTQLAVLPPGTQQPAGGDGTSISQAAPDLSPWVKVPGSIADSAARGVGHLLNAPRDIGNLLVGAVQDKFPNALAATEAALPGPVAAVGRLMSNSEPSLGDTLVAAGSNPAFQYPAGTGTGAAPESTLDYTMRKINPLVEGVASSPGGIGAKVAGAAGALGAQAYKDFVPDATWGTAVAGMAAGLPAGAAAELASVPSLAKQTAAKTAALTGNVTEAQQAVNQASNTVDDLTTAQKQEAINHKTVLNMAEPEIAAAQQNLANLQASHQAQNGEANLVAQQQAGQQLDSLLVGKSQTPQQAGQFAQQDARNYIANVAPKAHEALNASLEQALPGQTPGLTPNYLSWLKETNAPQTDTSLAATQIPSGAKSLLQAAQTETPQTVGGIATQLAPGLKGETVPTTVADMRAARSQIGDWLTNPASIARSGVPEAQLSAGYKAITQDMQNVAQQNGAGQQFADYNAGSTNLYNNQRWLADNVTKFELPRVGVRANPNDMLPEAVASNLGNSAKAGSTPMETLRQILPQSADEIAGSFIRQNGLAADGSIAPNFATQIEQMKKEAPASLAALVPDPGQRATIGVLADSGKSGLTPAQTEAQSAVAQQLAELQNAHAAYLLGRKNNAPIVEQQLFDAQQAKKQAQEVLEVHQAELAAHQEATASPPATVASTANAITVGSKSIGNIIAAHFLSPSLQALGVPAGVPEGLAAAWPLVGAPIKNALTQHPGMVRGVLPGAALGATAPLVNPLVPGTPAAK